MGNLVGRVLVLSLLPTFLRSIVGGGHTPCLYSIYFVPIDPGSDHFAGGERAWETAHLDDVHQEKVH